MTNSFFRTLSLAKRGVANFFNKRPFCVSFEVTYSCNARCKHCHLGGPVEEERASAESYAELCREIKPIVAQISGGEPLLRKDINDIVRAIRVENKAPYIVLTTNGTLLSKKKYLELREAGVDEFSLSFDFPDERHDEFRGVPGLFKKIEALIGEIKHLPDNGITLSGVVNRENFRELIRMAELAKEWNVRINFSTYTWLRTNKKELMVPKNDLDELKEIIAKLKEFKKKNKTVYVSDYVFHEMIEFFEKGTIGNCRAGERFFVVNPDGTLSPCGLIIKKFRSQREIIKNFTRTNECGDCYTSIRANTEKPTSYLIKDSLSAI
jgi:MoaA/NifB/PqqE/SkfB family radical SAM enzyme